jgi:hypothetical protein
MMARFTITLPGSLRASARCCESVPERKWIILKNWGILEKVVVLGSSQILGGF